MTSGQRKVHKFAWISIGIVIPVLIFFSIRNLDFQEPQHSSAVIETTSEAAIKSVENEFLKLNLYSNSIEVIVKTSLKTPSAVVYTINENEIKERTLGQVSTVGIYRFNTNERAKGIIIFDGIKKTEITKLSF